MVDSTARHELRYLLVVSGRLIVAKDFGLPTPK